MGGVDGTASPSWHSTFRVIVPLNSFWILLEALFQCLIKFMCLCADCVQGQIPVSLLSISSQIPGVQPTAWQLLSTTVRYPLASSHSAESSESSSDGARNVALLYLFGSGGGQAFGWHWMNFGNKFKFKPWVTPSLTRHSPKSSRFQILACCKYFFSWFQDFH